MRENREEESSGLHRRKANEDAGDERKRKGKSDDSRPENMRTKGCAGCCMSLHLVTCS